MVQYMLHTLKRHFGRIPGAPFSLKSGEVFAPNLWYLRGILEALAPSHMYHRIYLLKSCDQQTCKPNISSTPKFWCTHNTIVQSIILESHIVVTINPLPPYVTMDGTLWHKQLPLLYKTSLASKHSRGRDSKSDTPIDDKQMTKKMLCYDPCHSTEDSIDIDSIHISKIILWPNPMIFLLLTAGVGEILGEL